ncbi:MAG: acyl-CoA dehydrogenase family protein [Marinilabiliales bacterium]
MFFFFNYVNVSFIFAASKYVIKQFIMENSIIKGGEFLIKDVDCKDIFTPEDFNEEQKLIIQTCQDFLDSEVAPILDRIDNQEEGLMPSLLDKAGELGLLGASIPEKYEGFDQNFVTSMAIADYLGGGHSFSVAFSAHTGIGTLPLMYYGSHELKQKYLPRLASGELKAAYCLTEPNAGSDANSGKTKAVLSEDGKYYILNGQKMWITNGGFADLLTVFAKIDNDRVLSAFVVESKWDGISFNPEEKKMGIKGSSTRQIFFNDVKVPVENMIGQRGEGFRIALNILHVGRVKLGANVLGGGRTAINHSVNYANERKQFGRLISSFGAIKYKLAEQVIRQFTIESAVYRASGNIDQVAVMNRESGMEKGPADIDAISKYAIEAAILKVYGSEVLDYIVDEAVQIYGGMGFSSEAPVDRCYRDSRINRIFEGTNEINRMVIIDTLLKFIKRGDYALFEKAKELIDDIDNLGKDQAEGDYFDKKQHYIKNLKKSVLITLYKAHETLNKKIADEQEIMMNIADMIIQLYAAESTMLRVKKMEQNSNEHVVKIYKDILDVFLYDASFRINKFANDAINSLPKDNNTDKLLYAISCLTRTESVNIKEARRRIALKLIEENKYCF